ncbi:MAG TPA: hypothetical protein VFE16_13950 [Candidatus Cybelea sp.]|jgi:hypothetical protein|nr:hypothetical protein [Candidatus Cybelea sp.]
MRLRFGAILATLGVVLLGTSLTLLSAVGVSASTATAGQIERDSSCHSGAYCLVESNGGGGGAIKGTSGGRASAAAIFGQGRGFNSFGVEGQSTGSGGTGVYGISTTVSDGVGLFGVGAGVAVSAYNPSCCNTFSYGLFSSVNDPSSFPIYTSGAGTSAGSFIVDAAGDGTFDGAVTAFGGFYQSVPNREGAQLKASAPAAPRGTIEDTGTARLNGGVGVVHLERDFASMIDAGRNYQVFITPDGETRGWLYVAAKYQAGFIVREAEHGRSSTEFDYRIVAHIAGSPDERFPVLRVNRPHRPRVPAYLRQPQE